MNILFKFIFMALFICLLSAPVSAQPEWDDDPIDTPIDGGLSLLVVSGIGLGLHSLYKNAKAQPLK